MWSKGGYLELRSWKASATSLVWCLCLFLLLRENTQNWEVYKEQNFILVDSFGSWQVQGQKVTHREGFVVLQLKAERDRVSM